MQHLPQVGLSSIVDEEGGHFRVLDLDGQVQQAVALHVGGVDVCPGLQQMLGHCDLTRPQRYAQRSQVVRVTQVQVRGQQQVSLVAFTVF